MEDSWRTPASSGIPQVSCKSQSVFELRHCALCNAAGASKICSSCRTVSYCNRVCQAKHWKDGHKRACKLLAEEHASVASADTLREPDCPLCLESFGQLVKLPCSHALCCGCLLKLRETTPALCPLCRVALPQSTDAGDSWYSVYLEAVCLYTKGEMATEESAKHRLYRSAVKLLKAGAAEGYPEPQHLLARCYEQGKGVEQDKAAAIECYKISAEQGFVPSRYNLGLNYQEMQCHDLALKCFQAAAAKGHAMAQFNLACLYQRGKGVPQNVILAAKWCQASANQGFPTAQTKMGWFHQQGKGVKQDYTLAVKWYRNAASQGCAMGQHNLAVCYLKGLGVQKDRTIAIEYLQSAATIGSVQAQQWLCNNSIK